MSRIIDRAELLQRLESVQGGITQGKAGIMQSNCFVFQKGRVMTFNGEVFCKSKSGLSKKYTAVIEAEPLLKLLQKMKDIKIQVSLKNDVFTVQGTGKRQRKCDFSVEKVVSLPIDDIDKPGEWKNLPEDFGEAVGVVKECAGSDKSEFQWTCIHLNKKYMEACDNFQASRYRIKTRVNSPVLVKEAALRHVVSLDMTRMSETRAWIHFRNPTGLTLSCRRFEEEYPSIDELFNVDNPVDAILPKGLAESAEIAEIFSSQIKDSNLLLVKLSKNKIEVQGIGVSGKWEDSNKIKYDGKPRTFVIKPKMLMDIVKKQNECKIGKGKLLINGGKWKYAACLLSPKQAEKDQKKRMNEQEDDQKDDDEIPF